MVVRAVDFFLDGINLRHQESGYPSHPSPRTTVSLHGVWRRPARDLTYYDPEIGSRSEIRVYRMRSDGFETDFLVPKSPLLDPCVNRVRNWMEECAAHGCAKNDNSKLPKRVISVPSDLSACPKLYTTNGESGRYIALSHCWGQRPNMTKLTIGNVALWEDAIEASLLSRNFRDALVVTRRLGFPYIWIDALCIIQDSKEDW